MNAVVGIRAEENGATGARRSVKYGKINLRIWSEDQLPQETWVHTVQPVFDVDGSKSAGRDQIGEPAKSRDAIPMSLQPHSKIELDQTQAQSASDFGSILTGTSDSDLDTLGLVDADPRLRSKAHLFPELLDQEEIESVAPIIYVLMGAICSCVGAVGVYFMTSSFLLAFIGYLVFGAVGILCSVAFLFYSKCREETADHRKG